MSDWDKLGSSDAVAVKEKEADDRKRAGAVAGHTDVESWWEKGGVCRSCSKIFTAMSPYERVAFVNHPEIKPLIEAALDEVKAEWAKRDAETVPAILVSKGKSPRKRNVRPYWMRTIESLDRSKKGSERLVGDWVQEPASECDNGELIVCGLRYPEKLYALLRVTGVGSVSLFTVIRPDIEVKGVECLGVWGSFGAFMEAVERELMDGS